MKNLLIVVGTRPNFIKITQFPKVVSRYPDINLKILHTGQHQDENMSNVFFRQFDFEPDAYLELKTTTPISNIGEIIIGIEKYVNKFTPDLIMVVGDVNSTLAGAIAANKLGIPLAHLESGLRSGDRSMPEEINRILTDQVTDHFFVTEQSGIDHIRKEQLPGKIHFVGNMMIDTLVAFDDHISKSRILHKLGVDRKGYSLMTMHRPATVDNKDGLETLISLIDDITKINTVVFPIHPRTTKNLKNFGLWERMERMSNLILTEPLDYFAFQKLIADSKFVITDSGGIQEETTFRGVPCLTLRPGTERPSTVEMGTNYLVPFDASEIMDHISTIDKGTFKKGEIPPLWDGRATERIVKILNDL